MILYELADIVIIMKNCPFIIMYSEAIIKTKINVDRKKYIILGFDF